MTSIPLLCLEVEKSNLTPARKQQYRGDYPILFLNIRVSADWVLLLNTNLPKLTKIQKYHSLKRHHNLDNRSLDADNHLVLQSLYAVAAHNYDRS